METPAEPEDLTDDFELVAVIAAAIAASDCGRGIYRTGRKERNVTGADSSAETRGCGKGTGSSSEGRGGRLCKDYGADAGKDSGCKDQCRTGS